MTKEELKKEAEEYLKQKLEERKDKFVFELPEVYIEDVKEAYLTSAEPREKRIDELEEKNAELKSDNDARKFAMAMSEKVEKQLRKENAELKSIAEFQQSSNMIRHFENKKLKEGLAVGSILNKGLNSLNKALEEERDKYRNMVFDKDKQLTKAKEIISEYINILKGDTKNWKKTQEKAERFLK